MYNGGMHGGDNPFDPVRHAAQIQAAHDALCLAINNDVPSLTAMGLNMPSLISARDALCWVLKHDRNRQFTDVLKVLQHEVENWHKLNGGLSGDIGVDPLKD